MVSLLECSCKVIQKGKRFQKTIIGLRGNSLRWVADSEIQASDDNCQPGQAILPAGSTHYLLISPCRIGMSFQKPEGTNRNNPPNCIGFFDVPAL